MTKTLITLTEEQLSEAVARWCETRYPEHAGKAVLIYFEVSKIRSCEPTITAHVRENK